MEWGNLRNWLSGDAKSQELQETRRAWALTEASWRASPLATRDSFDLSLSLVKEAIERAERVPATPILVALCEASEVLFDAEDIGGLEADWPAIEGDLAIASRFREMMTRRRRWTSGFEQIHGIVRERLLATYKDLFETLPPSCFEPRTDDEDAFGVPLNELLDHPAQFIEKLVVFPYDDDTLRLDLFRKLRLAFEQNTLVASGFSPADDIRERVERLVLPTRHKAKTPAELTDLYLSGTPFADLMELAVPFHIPEEARFEHCHIVGGTGHGKTQLMQRMIHADLVRAQRETRSVVVIDSQGDLINKLTRLALFDPDAPDSLFDRIVLIDPADIEFPAALNLFDAHLTRLDGYRPIDRERVLNGVIELYEVFFGAMLGAELTQKQGVVFRYLARLMVTIPGATIHTLMQLMEDGKPFKTRMEALEGSARHFFETEFFHPSFAATKKQILRRLWGVLSTPAFERMFAQRSNKLDLFEAMNEGKIVLVSTAKDLLKADGSALLGRFFIAMLAQAALERSTLDPRHRTPAFVYVDEAQEYFDDSIETILNQARKYRVSLTLAHQTLDQLSPRLRSAILANTSFKCVGGVSAKDARALADELRTTSDFIEGMRRRDGRSEFAVWLKHLTPHAIRLSVPLGYLERQPLLTEEALAAVIETNRVRHCGTLADVEDFPSPIAPSLPAAPPARERTEVRASGIRPSGRDSGQYSARPAGPVIAPEPIPHSAEPEPSRIPRKAPRELGKGGSQHRYVQHLVKGLAEERGFRAVIEEPAPGGQVDVALHRDGISIACEISVTSTATYEAKNLAKCLSGGFARVFAIAADTKRLRAIEAVARVTLSAEQLACVDFLTPDVLPAALDALAAPDEETNLVRGYRVKVSRSSVGATEAKDRRATVARVIAQSMRGLSKDA